jgi:hypothetical protein
MMHTYKGRAQVMCPVVGARATGLVPSSQVCVVASSIRRVPTGRNTEAGVRAHHPVRYTTLPACYMPSS